LDKIIAYFIQLNKYKKTSKPYHIWASRSFCAVGSGQKQVIGSWERLGIMVKGIQSEKSIVCVLRDSFAS